MTLLSECPKGYRYPMSIISHAVYLYHRFTLSYRDVQELLFERGIDVSHETVRAWCLKFGPDLADGLRQHRQPRGCPWHLDDMRIFVRGKAHCLWRAVNEYGEVLDVLLQKRRNTKAAKRFFRRLLEDHGVPENVVTDGLRSYGAALRELPELAASEHLTVSASGHQHNLIEQSHRPTRVQERQQQGFRCLERTQRFLFTNAHIDNLFRPTRARNPADIRDYALRKVIIIKQALKETLSSLAISPWLK